VRGVRKIRGDELHSAPYPFSSKGVLVILSASSLESKVLRKGIPSIYYKMSVWEDQGIFSLTFLHLRSN